MIRRSTDYLVLHCSATPPKLDIGVNEIRQWHKAKGWNDIGYHYVIRRDGKVEPGRPENQVGSHVKGHNANSMGVCLVGGTDARQKPQDNFTAQQWASLQTLLMRLTGRYPRAVILGHRDFPGVAKACPCFNAIDWARGLGLPAARPMRVVTASMLRAIRVEIEDSDEQDDDLGDGEPTGGGKWLTAVLGSGGVGSLAGFGYGMDWLGILVFMGILVGITIIAFIAMGRERRERLWDRIVGF